MGFFEELYRNRGLTFVIMVVMFGVIWASGGIFDEGIKAEMDQGNWDTAVNLDLPVNVTRVILPASTTFTYAPRGDERAVFYIFNNDHVQSQSYNISFHDLVQSKGFSTTDPWPAVELKVIRNNGTVEDYQLPTRDVKEVSRGRIMTITQQVTQAGY